jgi:hypothetical protein
MSAPFASRFLQRLRCLVDCKGVYIYPLMGSGLDMPCPRCGRTRYIG